jgi:integrase
VKRFEKFLEFTGSEIGVKTPTDWLSWAKSNDSVLVGDIIEKFGATQSRYSQRFSMAVIRSHLKRNGFTNLPSMPGRSHRKQFHPGYERPQVQELLGYLDDKMQKLYVYFAKDSGLRAADVLEIRYKHIKKDFEAGKDFAHIEFEPEFYERRKASGITFIGPNSLKLLRELIATGRVKPMDDAKIFPFVYKTISFALRLAKKKAGLDPRIQPSHGLRKFFTASLSKVGMDEDRKRQLEGHSLGTEWAYTTQNIEELRKLYQQAYQFLDLSEEAVIDKNMQDLRVTLENQAKTITEQKRKIEALEDERSEMRDVVKFSKELMSNPHFQQFVKSLDKKPK